MPRVTGLEGMQKVATTGNATIIVYDGTPLLATDPWIGDEEPAYFGSWVLSHRIPQNLKDDIAACPYIWFSHGHPDHLNPTSIERFKGKKILLADHVGSRIHKRHRAQRLRRHHPARPQWVTADRTR